MPKVSSPRLRKLLSTPKSFFCLANLGISVLLSAGVSYSWADEALPTLSLQLPLACKINVNCWIARYMDHDPTRGTLDYACGHRAGDGHKGTDFAIRDKLAMLNGVPVVAAAAGTVERLRDGMEDVEVSFQTRKTVASRECGNGVVLRHQGDWRTQYCHMRRNSIVVHVGELVKQGQKLGLIGLSGLTQFPHVHLTVFHNSNVVDPFIGLTRKTQCGLGEHPLWRDDVLSTLSYQPFVIYHAGFADRAAKPNSVRAGQFDSIELHPTSSVIALWVEIFGIARGDLLSLRIVGPDGFTLVQRRQSLDTADARYFGLIGKKRRGKSWPIGQYLGEITLLRPLASKGQSFEKRIVREAVVH